MTTPPCDFCEARLAPYRYEVRPTVIAGTATRGDGHVAVLRLHSDDPRWFACERCRRLIASGRRDDLLDRTMAAAAARGLGQLPGATRAERRRHWQEKRKLMRAVHDAFWAARIVAKPGVIEP